MLASGKWAESERAGPFINSAGPTLRAKLDRYLAAAISRWPPALGAEWPEGRPGSTGRPAGVARCRGPVQLDEMAPWQAWPAWRAARCLSLD